MHVYVNMRTLVGWLLVSIRQPGDEVVTVHTIRDFTVDNRKDGWIIAAIAIFIL